MVAAGVGSSGMTILRKMWNSPAPSTRAASSSSSGTEPSMYSLARYTSKVLTKDGMSTAQTVSVRCRPENSRYIGSVSSAVGTRKDDMTRPISTALPRNSNLLSE